MFAPCYPSFYVRVCTPGTVRAVPLRPLFQPLLTKRHCSIMTVPCPSYLNILFCDQHRVPCMSTLVLCVCAFRVRSRPLTSHHRPPQFAHEAPTPSRDSEIVLQSQ
ncbi:hypothetical protein CRENBAI_005228 [Crenichthys baileyi]|uniref:Uncharacterized protein n=1 Tax=Crenichthys baileyi TaxID=28760 RepID=A0AAV9S6U7_9TELE